MESAERWKDYFRGDRFAALAGIELIDLEPGWARSRMVIGPQHLNAVGITQGGAIFTLADFTFAAAANSRGVVTVAVQVSIAFHRPTCSGTLVAEGREIARSRRMATYEVTVEDEQGERIATFTGISYVKDEAIAV